MAMLPVGRLGSRGNDQPPRLFTARYANPALAEHPAAKVQISLGAPKFRVAYEIHRVPGITPAGWMLNKGEAEFTTDYIRLLDMRGGATMVRSRLAEVARDADVDQLILCCFEDLRKPGAWCHRRIFAAWWREKTGQVVEELPEP